MIFVRKRITAHAENEVCLIGFLKLYEHFRRTLSIINRNLPLLFSALEAVELFSDQFFCFCGIKFSRNNDNRCRRDIMHLAIKEKIFAREFLHMRLRTQDLPPCRLRSEEHT